ncbi:mannan endo-1 4-beta-mannosidase 6 [Phtheirospermum japonicum]|uniref:mannan endo-1,4-beta-mannosidase n=1 Tax=Phtheirospermum japonicum TaxID=374723 RepID=A0A830CN41_9LAMI|nr:mannan endo-1 4-beta-mannosidase 6 [Phtheirospermum japonicum]
MDPQWRENKLYSILGVFAVISLFYLNFHDQLSFESPVVTWRLPRMGFVGVNHTRFVLLGDGSSQLASGAREVYVNGWNSYWLMEESVRGPSRRRVSEMLRRGAEMGLTVCRTWAFNDGDHDDSRLVNNLDAYGGKAQYVRWAEEAGFNLSSSSDSFFSDPIIKGYYKAYVKAVLTRKNYFTGVRYSDEPSIFAWELMNEPRCESISSAPALQAWITEMAAFVKSLDQKHLVTVGLEAVNDIDFASVHAYPHSWIPEADLEAKVKYLSNWLDTHISDSENVLKKPVLFTELGAPLTIQTGGLYDRDILLKTAYDKIYKSAEKREAGAGVLIWQLLVEGVEEYSDRFSLVASKYPSTYKLILDQSCRLRNMSSEGKTDNDKDPCF